MTALASIASHARAPATVPQMIGSRASHALLIIPHMETVPSGCYAQLEPNTGLYVVVDTTKRDMVDGATVAIQWHKYCRPIRPSISQLRYVPNARIIPGWRVREPFVPDGMMAMGGDILPASWAEYGVGHVVGVLANRDGTPVRNLWPDAHDYSDEARDIRKWPSTYCTVGDGTCLEPVYADGTRFEFTSRETPEPGDFVALWRKPELTGKGQYQCMIKRLVTPLPSDWADREQQRIAPPMILVEMLNPRTVLAIPLDDIMAVHKCIGATKMSPIPRPRPRRA